ncbi:class I SAM-dependent methyltransferase [Vibrio profundum]|uniref:methyltransferase domain-containing protein n=1 Tax=Vibrio profundum TaxID=2910247 RepID=UPI003D09B9E2
MSIGMGALVRFIKKGKHERRKVERINEQKRIMSEVFLDRYVVLNGPFKGTKYIGDAHGSMLLPKILGSYEEPIQLWIEKAINHKKYSRIIDIGCAEGYYACGFARAMPDASILAYDISKEAQKLTEKLAKENDLQNITISGECSHTELNEVCKNNSLVFCDIEGGEHALLNPNLVPNFVNVDLIIESHDCIIPNITEELIERFKGTHNISVMIDYPNRVKEYEFPQEPTESELKLIFDERRSKYMRFLYLEAKNPL